MQYRYLDGIDWTVNDDPRIRQWTAEQNQLTDEWIRENVDLEKRIDYLKQRPRQAAYRGIVEAHGQLYAIKQDSDSEISVVILDQNFHELATLMDRQRSAGKFMVYTVKPCPTDVNIVAFLILKTGIADPSVLVWDITADRALVTIDDVFYFDWSLDGQQIYYSDAVSDVRTGAKTNYVRSFRLADQHRETLYTEPQKAIIVEPLAAVSGRLYIKVNFDYHRVALKFIDLNDGQLYELSAASGEYGYVGSIGDRDYYYTNTAGRKGAVIALRLSAGKLVRELVIDADKIITTAVALYDKLGVIYLDNAVNTVVIYDQAGKLIRELELPDRYATIEPSGFGVAQGRELTNWYLSYESFICPPAVLRYDPRTNELRTVYRTAPLTGGRYTTALAWIPTRDGRQTLAFLVYDAQKLVKGAAPTIMYGYGGFGVNTTPGFTEPYLGLDITDWADRGGLYVHCVLRGGGEFGEAWHQDGMLKNKKNAFYDFIDIADWLIANGYTDPAHLAANGGSNGGLLMAAVLTMRPDLFKAVVMNVALTDMIDFRNDERGPMYITEYGDPADPDMNEYIRSYSPYQNIGPTAYPAIFIHAGEMDHNVPIRHSKKFYNRIRHYNRAATPILFRTLADGAHDVGHGETHFRLCAEEQLFIEKILGV